MALEKFFGRRERPDVVAFGAQQPRQRLQHAGVVINQEDREHAVHRLARHLVRHLAAAKNSCAGSDRTQTRTAVREYRDMTMNSKPGCGAYRFGRIAVRAFGRKVLYATSASE